MTHYVSHLATLISERATSSPEFWIFQLGANEKQIQKAQRKFFWPLPESLLHTAAVFDGGFASFQGKIDIYTPASFSQAKEQSNCFLSLKEIQIVYAQLLAAHPDEDPVLFPFIPVLRTKEGSYLVLDARLADESPLYQVWTLDGPDTWPKLYSSYASLLNTYIEGGGDIRTTPFDDVPFANPFPLAEYERKVA